MNLPRHTPRAILASAISLFSLSATQGFGQTATTNPVGYLQVQCLANSDTLVAIPFARPSAFVGAVSAVTPVASTTNYTISFTTTPAFTSGGFVYAPTATPAVTDNFYLSVGPKSAVLTGTLTLTQGSATVTGTGTAFSTQLVAGDRLSFYDGANQLTYTVAATPSSATSLTLDRVYTDSAVAGNPAGLSATFDHSPAEGRWYMVTANDATTVTINSNGDDLSPLVGAQVSVVTYWTLSTIFPDTDAGVSFTPTASTRSGFNTEVYIPTYASTSSSVPQGTTLSASTIYYYLKPAGSTTGSWRTTADPATDHGNDPLLPDGYFTVHNAGSAPSLPLTFVGSVPMQKVAVPLVSHATKNQDNAFGLIRPAGTTVGALGLTISTTNGDGGTFKATSSTRSLNDLLYLYDNGAQRYNKSASKIYYYSTISGNVGWRSTDATATDCSNDPVPAASALVVRKVATGTEQVTELVNNPNY